MRKDLWTSGIISLSSAWTSLFYTLIYFLKLEYQGLVHRKDFIIGQTRQPVCLQNILKARLQISRHKSPYCQNNWDQSLMPRTIIKCSLSWHIYINSCKNCPVHPHFMTVVMCIETQYYTTKSLETKAQENLSDSLLSPGWIKDKPVSINRAAWVRTRCKV